MKIIDFFFYFILSLLIISIPTFLLFWVFAYVICFLFPAVTEDGHHVMPIGQMLWSFILAAIAGIYLWIKIYIILKKKYN